MIHHLIITLICILANLKSIHGLVFKPQIKDPFDEQKFELMLYEDQESLNRLMKNTLGAGYIVEQTDDIGTYNECLIATNKNPTSKNFHDLLNNTSKKDVFETIETTLNLGLQALEDAFVFSSVPTQVQFPDSESHDIDINLETKFVRPLHLKEGFWAYRFIYSRDLLQYSGPTLNYTLGLFNEDSKPQLLSDEEGFYVSDVYDWGTICDVSGLPRTVEIQYVCDPNYDESFSRISGQNGPYLLWVKEWKICQYQAQIAVPGFCEIPLLKRSSASLESNKVFCKNPLSESTLADDKSRMSKEVDIEKLITLNHDTHFIGYSYYFLKNRDLQGPDYIVNSLSTLDFTMDLSFNNLLNSLGPSVLNRLVPIPIDLVMSKKDFQWMCEVFSLNGQYMFTIIIKFGSVSSIEITGQRLTEMDDVFDGNFVMIKESSDPDDVNEGLNSQDHDAKTKAEEETSQSALNEKNESTAVTSSSSNHHEENTVNTENQEKMESNSILHESNTYVQQGTMLDSAEEDKYIEVTLTTAEAAHDNYSQKEQETSNGRFENQGNDSQEYDN